MELVKSLPYTAITSYSTGHSSKEAADTSGVSIGGYRSGYVQRIHLHNAWHIIQDTLRGVVNEGVPAILA